jgi:hypothetical protein
MNKSLDDQQHILKYFLIINDESWIFISKVPILKVKFRFMVTSGKENHCTQSKTHQQKIPRA